MVDNKDYVKLGAFFIILFFIVLCICLLINNNKQKETTVDKKSNQYLKESITDKKNIKVVLYKQKTCPHCVDFMETWNSLKNEFDNLGIEHETIECSEGGCDDILYIPTIKMIANNKTVIYDGNRNKQDIMKFIYEL